MHLLSDKNQTLNGSKCVACSFCFQGYNFKNLWWASEIALQNAFVCDRLTREGRQRLYSQGYNLSSKIGGHAKGKLVQIKIKDYYGSKNTINWIEIEYIAYLFP